MEAVKLKSLYDFLCEGVTAAQLADAVERTGIHGWDRFGRFGQYTPASKACAQALDALSRFYAKQEEFLHDIENNPPHDSGDASSRDMPLDIVSDMPTVELHRFGWPLDKLPEIDHSSKHPQAPRSVPDSIEAKKLLETIGAILEFLASRPRPISQSEVISAISGRNPEVIGLQKSTLEKRFAAANAVLKDAKKK